MPLEIDLRRRLGPAAPPSCRPATAALRQQRRRDPASLGAPQRLAASLPGAPRQAALLNPPLLQGFVIACVRLLPFKPTPPPVVRRLLPSLPLLVGSTAEAEGRTGGPAEQAEVQVGMGTRVQQNSLLQGCAAARLYRGIAMQGAPLSACP